MRYQKASVAQLKAGLSHYLEQARAGYTIEVTSHRRVVARVVGIPDLTNSGLPAELADMVAQGMLTPGDGKPVLRGLPKPLKLSAGPSVAELVIEGRGAR